MTLASNSTRSRQKSSDPLVLWHPSPGPDVEVLRAAVYLILARSDSDSDSGLAENLLRQIELHPILRWRRYMKMSQRSEYDPVNLMSSSLRQFEVAKNRR